MSANRSDYFGDINLSSHLPATDPPADQSSRAVTDTVKTVPLHSPLDPHLQSKLRIGGALSGAKPPLKKQMPPLQGKYHQNAIPRASVADVAPSWSARATNRAFDQRQDVQRTTDLLRGDRLPFVRVAGGASGETEARKPRQRVGQLIGHAVAEVVVAGRASGIHERQHGHSADR